MTSRRRRILLLILAILAVGLGVVAALMFATPDLYERVEPMGPDAEALADFDRRVVNGVANVLLDESGGTRLDVELTEAMLNARWTRYVEDMAGAGEPLAPAVANLRFALDEGRLVLATRLGDGAGAVVVTQAVTLEATGDGRLRVRPGRLAAGHLPLPAVVAEGLLDRLQAVDEESDDEPQDRVAEVLTASFDALRGGPVRLADEQGVGLYLERVEVTDGRLVIEARRWADAAP